MGCRTKRALLRLETRTKPGVAPLIRAKVREVFERTQHMLNELESLSQNIGRLIKISERLIRRATRSKSSSNSCVPTGAAVQGELAQMR